jgi:2-methylisocitrate lyase-like PEP mutase family enzyme
MNPGDAVRVFAELHKSGCFVLPNPWDLGSARLLERLGFSALATTSSGFAWSRGQADNHVTLDDVLLHLREMAEAVDVPVNADFEGGFAVEPSDVAKNVLLASDTGIAGLSIEDSTGDINKPLFEFKLALERVQAARRALNESDTGVLLTARTEGFIVGRPDLDETIRRLTAFADAGADCLYAPGIRGMDQIAEVVKAVAPKPVNFLNMTALGFTVKELADMGVRRISVGGTLARVAMDAFVRAATEIAKEGKFDRLGGVMSNADLNTFFKRPT